METNQIIPITSADASQIGQARRRAASMGANIGLSEVRQAELSIVVTEAARNIAAHANEGHLIVSPWIIGEKSGIDIFAIDKGKGIPNIDRACEDGFSTAGTAGQGLGAISRLAGNFQIYSAPNAGTVLFARIFRETAPEAGYTEDLSIGAVSVPMAGETVCGDAWAAFHKPGRSLYFVADGLGHGQFASEAGQEAVRVFRETSERSPEFILREVHQALVKTRGAAVSVAEILDRESCLNYAGAGNVSAATYFGGKSKSLVSMNGTVGHSVAKFQQFSYPWERNSLLVMHSDGLTTRWNIDQYPGLASRHPALIAAVLYRDFVRGRDDATILVIRR